MISGWRSGSFVASSHYTEWVILQLHSSHIDTVTKAVCASVFLTYKEIQLAIYILCCKCFNLFEKTGVTWLVKMG